MIAVVLLSGCDILFQLRVVEPVDAGTDAVGVDASVDAMLCPGYQALISGSSSRYRVITDSSTLFFQRQKCLADGAHLAALDTAGEMAMLVPHLPVVPTEYWVGVMQG